MARARALRRAEARTARNQRQEAVNLTSENCRQGTSRGEMWRRVCACVVGMWETDERVCVDNHTGAGKPEVPLRYLHKAVTTQTQTAVDSRMLHQVT
eukprot:2864813-Rhodomonas_salina.4